jgi:hypothetical protein
MRWTTFSFAPSSKRFDAIPRLRACQPYHSSRTVSTAGRMIRRPILSKSMCSPPPDWNITPFDGLPMERRYVSRISANCRMTGTDWALAVSYAGIWFPHTGQGDQRTAGAGGRKMTVYKPERVASGVTRGAERRDGVRSEARSELRDCTHSEMKEA